MLIDVDCGDDYHDGGNAVVMMIVVVMVIIVGSVVHSTEHTFLLCSACTSARECFSTNGH